MMMIAFYSQYVQLSCIIIREQAAGNILGLCKATLCCYFFARCILPSFSLPITFSLLMTKMMMVPFLFYHTPSCLFDTVPSISWPSLPISMHTKNHDPLAIIIHSHSTKRSSMKLFPLTDLSTKAFHISPAFLLISVIDSSGYFFLRLGLISCIQSM